MIDELERRFAKNIRCFIYEDSATFLLHGIISKKILGYQVYSPYKTKERKENPRDCRYFTYQRSSKQTGEYGVFGLEYIENRNILFVTEGIFEACRLISLGFDAIAILTANPPRLLINQLLTINENIIWCGDNDTAGKKSRLAKFIHMYFDKDLDEVPEDLLLKKIGELHVQEIFK